MIDTMPNLRPDVATRQIHRLPLPPMCPISGNPQPGSMVVIRYTPADRVLEVYSLETYIRQFVGGWLRDGQHIRDMEQTIQAIAADCAAVAGVPVTVIASLRLDAGSMVVRAEAQP